MPACYRRCMDTRRQALQGRLQGLTYQAIATTMKLSRQRVQQLVSPPLAIRQLVQSRAHGCCEHCGIVTGRAGHIHHRQATGLMPDQFNDLENLQLLCARCHREAHGSPPLRPDRPRTQTAPALDAMYHCLRCGADWLPRHQRLPKRCPRCVSLNWHRSSQAPQTPTPKPA